MPTISVAMATYNGATYLREQLDSILAQSHLPIEIVIGDDGSRDDTVRIAEAFASEAPFPVRIYRNETNLGFADNFLTTAERCTGDWIAFCDQDDYWYPSKLARIAAEIEGRTDQELVMVCHVAEVVDAKLTPTGKLLPAIDRTHLEPANSQTGFWCMGGCVMVVRGDLVREIDFRHRPPDDWPGAHKVPGTLTLMPHDKWMSMLSNSLGNSLFLAETLAWYRRHETTVTGSKEEAPATARLLAARSTGSGYYRFRAETAQKSAVALRALASQLGDRRSGKLEDSACRFDAMSVILMERARLYEQVRLIDRVRHFAALVRRGAYLGDPVSSLGGMSLLKDLTFCLSRGLIGESATRDNIAS